jgi:hypothetical protein
MTQISVWNPCERACGIIVAPPHQQMRTPSAAASATRSSGGDGTEISVSMRLELGLQGKASPSPMGHGVQLVDLSTQSTAECA